MAADLMISDRSRASRQLFRDHMEKPSPHMRAAPFEDPFQKISPLFMAEA